MPVQVRLPAVLTRFLKWSLFFVPYIPSVSVGILTRLYINDRILAVIKTEKRNVNIAEQAQNTRRNQKMLNQFSRTELLIGKEGMEKLKNSRVAVFGIGGVGGYTVEALVRSGVGTMDLIDDDKVCLTNINRQIYATRKTVGKYKVDVARERILEINPDAVVNIHKTFYVPETADFFDFSQYDYVVDAIDTVTGKLMLVEQAQDSGTPIISSMERNKMDLPVLCDGYL